MPKGCINSGTFSKGHKRIFEKTCDRCNKSYTSKSGSRKWCDDCKLIMSICPICGLQKDIYDETCGPSCAGKLKWERSEKLRSSWTRSCQTPETKRKRSISLSRVLKGKPKLNLRGKNNPNWKGGTYGTERHKEMGRVGYKNWVVGVFKRDGYTCQVCKRIGGDLNAHHIKLWKDFPELRFDVNNGITLCVDCHYLTHKNK
jgi:5-methylcytosine-specific restriction endonuclease McrA